MIIAYMQWYLVGSLLSFILGGGIMAAILANIFAEKRDKEYRRIQFLKKMGVWRTRVHRCVIASKLAEDFPKDVAEFGGEYVAIEGDLSSEQRENFHRVCDQIVAMTDSDVEQTAPDGALIGKARLLERIDEIILILE